MVFRTFTNSVVHDRYGLELTPGVQIVFFPVSRCRFLRLDCSVQPSVCRRFRFFGQT